MTEMVFSRKVFSSNNLLKTLHLKSHLYSVFLFQEPKANFKIKQVYTFFTDLIATYKHVLANMFKQVPMEMTLKCILVCYKCYVCQYIQLCFDHILMTTEVIMKLHLKMYVNPLNI